MKIAHNRKWRSATSLVEGLHYFFALFLEEKQQFITTRRGEKKMPQNKRESLILHLFGKRLHKIDEIVLICYDVSYFHVAKVTYNSHLRKYFPLFLCRYKINTYVCSAKSFTGAANSCGLHWSYFFA